ncbi:MAG: response regulator transcription factor [Bacillaceae bacterium]
MKILVLDDEKRMLDLLELVLTLQGYEVICSTSYKEVLHLIQNGNIDVLLLDLMMPDCDGISLCKQIRLHSDIPIIMLTARGEKEDIVTGFQAGADDYVTKPFDEDILNARIKAVVKRKSDSMLITIDGLKIEKDTIYVTYKGIEIILTPIEYRILNLFISNTNKMFSRDQVKMVVYKNYEKIDNRTVDSHIRNLREKLRKSGFHVDDYLKTVYGYGYRWEKL